MRFDVACLRSCIVFPPCRRCKISQMYGSKGVVWRSHNSYMPLTLHRAETLLLEGTHDCAMCSWFALLNTWSWNRSWNRPVGFPLSFLTASELFHAPPMQNNLNNLSIFLVEDCLLIHFMLHRIIHPIDPMGWCGATQKDKAPWSQSFACVWPRCYTLIVTTIKTWANCCILVDRAFLLKWPSSSGLRAVHSFEKMDAMPSELQPPQLIYIMLMCLRALALQAGVFVSLADISWEQANPNGTNGPVGCTIGDRSNLGLALQCIEVSDSNSDPKRRNLKVLVEKHMYQRRMMAHGNRRTHHLVEGNNALPVRVVIKKGKK